MDGNFTGLMVANTQCASIFCTFAPNAESGLCIGALYKFFLFFGFLVK